MERGDSQDKKKRDKWGCRAEKSTKAVRSTTVQHSGPQYTRGAACSQPGETQMKKNVKGTKWEGNGAKGNVQSGAIRKSYDCCTTPGR